MAAWCERARSGFRNRGALAVGILLVLVVATGGSSHGHGPAMAAGQLAALPVLGWALLAACAPHGGHPLPRAPLVVVAAIVLLVAALQLPIPLAAWEMPAARAALAADLHSAGVSPAPHWALAPLASERALWFLLPGLAVFAGALFVEPSHLRGLLLLVVALGFASLVLGAMQMAAPRDSLLNPYPQWAPAFNGVFENPNHQASLLALSATVVAALPWHAPAPGGHRLRRSAPAWILLGVLAALAVPLTGSRAGLGLAALGVGLALGIRWRYRRLARGAAAPAGPRAAWPLAGAALAAAALALAVAWPRLGVDETMRWSLAEATAKLARDHGPLGAGAGVFATWFDQGAPAALVQWEYFHHAHNEYVQWWFELGVAGVACTLAAVGLVFALRPRPATYNGARPGARAGFGVPLAAWLGCVLLLLHSLVDYVLRTPALMAVGALMAGVLVASHARPPHVPRTGTKEPR